LQRQHRFFLLTAIPVLLVVLGSGSQSRQAPQTSASRPSQHHTVYLPALTKADRTSQPSGGNRATFWLPNNDFDGAGIATNNPEVAIDPQGSIHIAYRISARTTNGQWPAYYLYCATRCADPARWSRVALGEDVVDVRLQLDPARQPRLLLTAYSEQQPYDWLKMKELQYAT
jgi:hypothetical protein